MMNQATAQVFAMDDVRQFCEEMNSERADDLLMLAQVYGKQHGAKAASMVGFNAEGMDLDLEFLYSQPKRLNIRFGEPQADIEHARHHLDEMTHRAHKLLKHSSNEPLGRTIHRMLPEWLRR